ncbi:YggS family pyridoxal phosphate-dependent enzyme [Candidatus Pelagibacter sp.]|nr:YggS family pyridoxal phosphate-dependent enzyme [Candidatus Pelagibacter sp.]
MHKSINNLISVKKELEIKSHNQNVEIIAVSKTFPINEILPLIEYGHEHFGENKVQEAIVKWSDLKLKNKKINLHLIGKLQSNKVKNAVKIFDYIHSLDNIKLANKIAVEQKKINKSLKLFIQINIGNENQKNGLMPDDLKNFYNQCINELNLNIIGLMCIPPQTGNMRDYFNKMLELKNSVGLKDLSMGMSNDYLEAANCGASFLRIGSKIFGERN